MEQGKLETGATARLYALGGNATLTVVSLKTGMRFTYRIRKPAPHATEPAEVRPWWVSVLARPENDADGSYTFIGGIKRQAANAPLFYWHSPRSSIGSTAPSAQAASWFFPRLLAATELRDVEIWHEGRCGRCGRKLTVPESVAAGFGPECSDVLGLSQPAAASQRPHNLAEEML